ncbi:MAG: hypothetical protein ABS46_18780 [Cytophagaceae bacterium SCN 52-12]|nr:MAG: hypothetical protein ABS46_18780 [Cytophagaceae bacterium SCN 52-12]
MIIYLIKGIACSFVLWAFHHFFLEKERMHRFNRFYLLAAPVISFLIPFIPLRQAAVFAPAFQAEAVTRTSTEAPLLQAVQTAAESDGFPGNPGLFYGLPAVYLLVTLLLLIRLVRGIIRIRRRIRVSRQHQAPEAILVLLPGQQEICTFMHYVLCSEQDYRENLIPAPILQHEFTHVKQKHTWDNLFIELVGAVYWFNPVIVLYKRAIRLNHEFLADRCVTEQSGKISDYQRLLLDWLTGEAAPQLASGFNYSQTKKRLIMMTQKPDRTRMIMKGACLSILTGGLLYAVSDEIAAQVAPPPPPVEVTYAQSAAPPPPFELKELPVMPPPPPPSETATPGAGATEEELAYYNASFERHKIEKLNKKAGERSAFAFTNEEKERLWQIAEKMSVGQKRQQTYVIIKKDVPRKNPPSAELFESFKRADVYGVWLDDRKVDNLVLNEHTHADIADYSISKLYGAAKKGRSYTHQINIETNAYFDANFRKRMADRFIVSERVKTEAGK